MAGLYVILDWPHAGGLDAVSAAEGLVGGCPDGPGPRLLQLRCKDSDTAMRIALIEQVGPTCRAAGVPLIVNDDLEAALARPMLVGGLHLGQDDLYRLGAPPTWAAAIAELRARGLIVGLSTHDLAQVRATEQLPVDYIGFGPVLATRSKLLPEPCVGFDGLAAACTRAPHPVVAIGGLDSGSALHAARCGATMVATISALVATSVQGVHAKVVALATALAAE